MITFIIKSTICLTVLYGFYHLVLQNIKTFNFNRFYLIFSLLFSLTIPLVTIHVNLHLNPGIQGLSGNGGNLVQFEGLISEQANYFSLQDILIVLYSIVSMVLLIRFAVNIHRITKMIRKGSRVHVSEFQLVLIENKILPYSFFGYIFVNRRDYESGEIAEELLIHEQTHCLQYHSVDILIIEMVKIILWFNPMLLLFRKAIELNHEFLADYRVLSACDLNHYQNTLINLVCRNSTTYLASNFNYSLTKKRLIMMMKNNASEKVFIKKIVAIPLFLILTVTLCFCQESKPKENMLNIESEWWYPILKKQNIELGAFNNFSNVFETGSKNSIYNRIATLENATFIIKDKYENYLIVKSPLAYHDLDKNIIRGEKGVCSSYDLKSGNTKNPKTLQSFKFYLKKDGSLRLASRNWDKIMEMNDYRF